VYERTRAFRIKTVGMYTPGLSRKDRELLFFQQEVFSVFLKGL
jgi:hypothetical protein